MSPGFYIAYMTSNTSALPAKKRLADPPLHFATADSDDAILGCYALMCDLRPQLGDAQAYLAQVRRMQGQGYVLLAARLALTQQAVAIAGYRLSETLVYGPYLYIDDLVTCLDWRGQGLGHALLQHVFALAHAQGLQRVVLDTRLDNLAAQRFYQRAGMQAQALRFGLVLEEKIECPIKTKSNEQHKQ